MVDPTGISARLSKTPLFKLLPSKEAPAITYSLGSLKFQGLMVDGPSTLSLWEKPTVLRNNNQRGEKNANQT